MDKTLSPLLSECSFLIPEDAVVSAWTEHAPFAFWLAEQLAPRTFVELGTHLGYSFFAVCQLVKKLGLATACYAVDTWAGDDHAGFYDGSVYAGVATLNEKYRTFSTLIRSTFAEAVASFADKSINLLHIDGRHFYEDIKEDFESWLPKVAEGGIVLFHDTAVRERDFGVWQLFDELKATYPTFEFFHGHGLGVLAVGPIPAVLTALFSGDDAIIQFTRAAYSALGARLQHRFEAEEILARSQAETKRVLGIVDKLRSDIRTRSSKATEEATHHREELIRLLSQQMRPTPVSQLPSFLRRRNPLAARDPAYATLVKDYETLARSPLFDPAWYLEKYPDVAEKGEDPVHHYLKFGSTYPMSPGPHFDVHWYLQQNPDVSRDRENPLLHFIRQGASEKRSLGLSALDAQSRLGPTIVDGEAISESTYETWVRECDTLSDDDRAAIRNHIESFARKPLISVVMPAYDTPEDFLRQAIDSVLAQLYPHWELCVADDASPSPHVVAVLDDYAFDSRIKWMRRDTNGHISAATNSALALATGKYVALMDHDDILPEHALYEVAHEINQHPDADIIYSDEDHIDGSGRRNSPYFKTDWNRELMLGHNMINHLGVYRRALVESVGGLREGFEGSQDYDLALRATDASCAARIRHIPAILYHWRQSANRQSFSESQLERCAVAAQRAVAESLERNREKATVERHPMVKSWQRIRRTIPHPAPLVSLIVPTKDNADLLAQCAEGILDRTDYRNVELIIVDHDSREKATQAVFTKLKKDRRVQIMPFEGAFNYSAINNAAARLCKGHLIGLINNDIDVIEPGWLTEMVSIAILPEVGAVGARLLYNDGSVQHAGVVLGPGGVAGHLFKHLDRYEYGYFGRAVMTSAVSAVTAACLLVRKSVFDEVGGLDADNLPIAFNDIDFCLKVRELGYRNVFTPHAELYHFESVSRGSDMRPDRIAGFQSEVAHMIATWGKTLEEDPYFNVAFSLKSENPALAIPARRQRPWANTAS